MRERKAIQIFGMVCSENAMEFLFKIILQIREKIAVEIIKQNFVIPSVINTAHLNMFGQLFTLTLTYVLF